MDCSLRGSSVHRIFQGSTDSSYTPAVLHLFPKNLHVAPVYKR